MLEEKVGGVESLGSYIAVGLREHLEQLLLGEVGVAVLHVQTQGVLDLSPGGGQHSFPPVNCENSASTQQSTVVSSAVDIFYREAFVRQIFYPSSAFEYTETMRLSNAASLNLH